MTFESQVGRFISFSFLDTLLWHMSENKLRKYLKRPLPPIIGQQLYTPIVISDSKGKYLKDNCSTEIEHNIKWRCASIIYNSWNRAFWQHPSLHLAWYVRPYSIWQNNKIYFFGFRIRCNNRKKTTAIFRKIIEITQKYSSCKLTFLEIPVYSIFEWNKYQGHPTPSSFKKKQTTQ